MKKFVLITGGLGFIGSNVALQILNDTQLSVLIVDNLSNSLSSTFYKLKSNYKDRVVFVNSCFSEFQFSDHSDKTISLIIHLAAFKSLPESISDPIKYYDNNVCKSIKLIRDSYDRGIKNFIFSSTGTVYKSSKENLVEDSVLQPLSPYAKSKFIIEEVLKDMSVMDNSFKYIVFRFFNIAGANSEMLLGDLPESNHVIPKLVSSGLSVDPSIAIYGDSYDTLDGTCVRDYVHVKDLAIAHIKSIDYLLKSGKSNIFNIGSSTGYSVKEIYKNIENLLGIKFNVNICGPRIGDLPRTVCDNQKILRELGFSPKYDLKSILEDTIMFSRKRIKLGEV